MTKIFISPGSYIQGPGELNNLGKHVSALGDKFFVLISESGKKRFKDIIQGGFDSENTVEFRLFNGEASKNEIARLQKEFQQMGADAVIGVGGGKIHDTAKAVGYYEKAPVIVVPTIASTDAPTSALSVLYTDDGEFDEYLMLPSNPNMVLVDTEVVVQAPTDLFVAGMGDALATKFEARAVAGVAAEAMAGGQTTRAAQTLANLAYDTLISDGYNALVAVDAGVVTPAVEKVVEATTLLSGLGFESGGLSAAHAVHNGLTSLPEVANIYHGNIVAFGTLVQLVLEDADADEIEEVIEFCMSVGLPTTLEEIGLGEAKEEDIKKAATLAASKDDTAHNLSAVVTPETMYAAIMGADALGKSYKL